MRNRKFQPQQQPPRREVPVEPSSALYFPGPRRISDRLESLPLSTDPAGDAALRLAGDAEPPPGAAVVAVVAVVVVGRFWVACIKGTSLM